jgi:SAM-dependent methyltransferase
MDDTARRLRAVTGFYGPLEDSADAARRVGWESAAAQRLRLETLATLAGPLDEVRSVLDAGCGEGALFEVLGARGFAGHYRGEDLREAPILRARAQRPGAEWVVADAFAERTEAELVFCSGALNTDAGREDHMAEVMDAVTALFGRATVALVFDIAVKDRHHPGVMLAAADLLALFSRCRELAPAVSVHEDTVVGEAVFVLWRSRARRFTERARDPLLAAENLQLAGEAEAALSLVERAGEEALRGREGRAERVRGQALSALGRVGEALLAFHRASESGDIAEATRARLLSAPLLWRTGKRAEAERLLVELAERDDEARGHLFELQLARKQVEAARATAAKVVDPWMRRELERILAAR